jgi:predicted kinase
MIWIITGPPCSGKSTYINENAKNDDVIIDMDKIALAFCTADTKPFEYDDMIRKIARSARQAAVKEAIGRMQGERYRNLFIIHTDPNSDQRMSYRAANARFVELDPGKEICLERLKKRPEQNQQIAKSVIDDFYARRNK